MDDPTGRLNSAVRTATTLMMLAARCRCRLPVRHREVDRVDKVATIPVHGDGHVITAGAVRPYLELKVRCLTFLAR